ncbi:MAG TPA: hypothetical protein VF414_00430, partial [Thermoanaerobaculia bacterium]
MLAFRRLGRAPAATPASGLAPPLGPMFARPARDCRRGPDPAGRGSGVPIGPLRGTPGGMVPTPGSAGQPQ